MLDRDKIVGVCQIVIAILFTSSKDNVKNVRVSTIDTLSSLYSELSFVNDELQEAIDFNSKLICSEYIDYLISEISNMNNVTMDFSKAKALIDMTYNISKNVSLYDDEKMREHISTVQSKISGLIKHDIGKTSSLGPVVKSKATDLVLSARERITELSDRCYDLKTHITNCEDIIEACDFITEYVFKKMSDEEGYVVTLEEPYERIMSIMASKYVEWKEGA